MKDVQMIVSGDQRYFREKDSLGALSALALAGRDEGLLLADGEFLVLQKQQSSCFMV